MQRFYEALVWFHSPPLSGAQGDRMHKKNVKKEVEKNRRSQRIKIRKMIILDYSLKDREISEYISKSTRIEVIGKIKGELEVHLVPDIEKGEIIIDSYGKGSFQRNDVF